MLIPKPTNELISWMRDIRRQAHQIPELGYQEKKTASFIIKKLSELDIPYRSGIATTGIIATLGDFAEHLPCVALRADIDGLPISEKTGLAYSSKHPGIMHACGHDGHIAMLLGAAALLRHIDLKGRVLFIFQPAEEGGGGAERIVKEGGINGVDFIFGGHIDLHLNTGEIVVAPGLICAQADAFSIHITGKGGHAGKPHETIDAIVVASQLIMSIQALVARELNPSYPATVTIGTIRGGTARNVIAEHVELKGTIRSTNYEVRQQLFSGLERVAKAMGHLSKATVSIQFVEGYKPVINDLAATEIAQSAAEKTVGPGFVRGLEYPSLGGEDFSFYLAKVAGCFVRFGARLEEEENYPAHSPYFNFNESVLPVGAQFLATVAIMALG